jgi:RluA family pseudouridine synthase
MIEWILTSEEDRLTALELLQTRLPQAPVAYLRQLLRGGKVRRNGEPLAAEDLLYAQERLTLPGSERLRRLCAAADAAPLTILCENDHLLVLDKPAGLAVHRGVGHEADNLADRVNDLLRRRHLPFRAAPVHRLDADTSGPVLFGKGRRATAALGRLFMEHAVEKTYLALVAGETAESGLLCAPVPSKGRLREAATAFRRIAAGGGCSLLALQLLTGRTHQIRRQLAQSGHPVAGDRRYGGRRPAGLARLFLHCTELRFRAPFDQTLVAIRSPLPPELARTLTALGIDPAAAGVSGFCERAPLP